MRLIFFLLLIFVFAGQSFYSQCCAGCNPIGGNTNQGTLPKYTLQFNSYYKYGYSEGYSQNDHPSDFKFVQNANSRFVGVQLGYGLFKKFTVQVEGGYYINRTQNFNFSGTTFSLNGYGGSSATFSGKLNLIKDTIREFEFTIAAGVRVPWSTEPQVIDGVQLTEDVQPSSGAYGLVIQDFIYKEFDNPDIKVFLMNNININGTNPRNYREGNIYITSIFVSKSIRKMFTGIMQVRNEYREYSYRDNLKVLSSGGYRFLLVPQLNFSFQQKYNVSFLYEIPIYQFYNGIQLDDKYAFSLNLNIRFGLSKKANALCKKP